MATTLTLEQMKKFVRDHFEDFVNKRNAAVIRRNMTPDFHDHDGPGGKTTDIAGDEQMMVGMYKFMPDLPLTIEDMIAEGDKVVCRIIRWTDPSGKTAQPEPLCNRRSVQPFTSAPAFPRSSSRHTLLPLAASLGGSSEWCHLEGVQCRRSDEPSCLAGV
jgi:predicted ester cyclase